MWSYTGIFILGIVANGVFSQDGTNLCAERKISGFVCTSDCKSVAFCMNFGDKWETMITETCGADEYCSQTNGTCTKEKAVCNNAVDDVNFACKTEGWFPDPYDCHKYYVCYKPPNTKQIVAVNINCPQGTAFNAAKGDCSITAKTSTCTTQQFNCAKPGDMHAWPTNKNIFYACIKQGLGLFPSLTRCDQGYVFRDGACVWDYTHPEEEELITSENPLPAHTTPQSKVTCSGPSRFPDGNDCHKYYYCSSANAQPIHYQCPQGTYYSINRCILGKC